MIAVIASSAQAVAAPAATTIAPNVVASENAGPIEADANTERSNTERTLRSCVQFDETGTKVQPCNRIRIPLGSDRLERTSEEGDERRLDDVRPERTAAEVRRAGHEPPDAASAQVVDVARGVTVLVRTTLPSSRSGMKARMKW